MKIKSIDIFNFGFFMLLILICCVTLLLSGGYAMQKDKAIALPTPDIKGVMPFETVLMHRRSIRDFKSSPLTIKQISQLVWAAQGITDKYGFRTTPSAGALYPLEIYVVAGRVDGLNPGIYRYVPKTHELKNVKTGEYRNELCDEALNQDAIRNAPASIVISGILKRTTGKYGKRGLQYVLMETGHAGQNILLEAVGLGLGAVPIGAFDDSDVGRLMGFNADEVPFYIIPVGIPKE